MKANCIINPSTKKYKFTSLKKRKIVANFNGGSVTGDLPDLILIDGGKGQLNAVQDLFPQAEFASLAKREETVFSKRLPEGKVLDQATYMQLRF